MSEQNNSIHKDTGRIDWCKLREEHLSGQFKTSYFQRFDKDLIKLKIALEYGDEDLWRPNAKQLLINLIKTIGILVKIISVFEQQVLDKEKE